MVILTSNGLTSENIRLRTKSILPKNYQKAAIITNASDNLEYDPQLPIIEQQLQSLGLTTTPINLELTDTTSLTNFDVLVLLEGNPFVLYRSILLHDLEPLFKQFANERLLIAIGTSCAVLAPKMNYIDEVEPHYNANIKLHSLEGLNIVSHAVLPHYFYYLEHDDTFEQTLQEYEQRTQIRIIRIPDREAIFVDFTIKNPYEKTLIKWIIISFSLMIVSMVLFLVFMILFNGQTLWPWYNWFAILGLVFAGIDVFLAFKVRKLRTTQKPLHFIAQSQVEIEATHSKTKKRYLVANAPILKKSIIFVPTFLIFMYLAIVNADFYFYQTLAIMTLTLYIILLDLNYIFVTDQGIYQKGILHKGVFFKDILEYRIHHRFIYLNTGTAIIRIRYRKGIHTTLQIRLPHLTEAGANPDDPNPTE